MWTENSANYLVIKLSMVRNTYLSKLANYLVIKLSMVRNTYLSKLAKRKTFFPTYLIKQ